MMVKFARGSNKIQVPKRCTKVHTSMAATISKANTELEVPKIIKKAPPGEREAKTDCSKKGLKRSPWKQSIMQTTLISA